MMKNNNKILTALLALAIAISLWVYVVTVVKPESTETYYNIPVALEGENQLTDRGLMIIGGKNATVTMELYGNRTDLDKVNSGNITLIADVTKIDGPGEVELPYSYRFPGDVPSGALTVQSKSPGTVKLTVVERISKSINVVPKWVGEMPDSAMYLVNLDSYVLDYPSIQIVGPDMVIEQIDHAQIEVDLTGKTESFYESYRITLCDKDGNGVDAQLVTVSQEEVKLELKIEYVKNIQLKVEWISGGGATPENTSVTRQPPYIQVSGNTAVLSKMTELVVGSVDLGLLTETEELTFPIVLPDGLTNRSGIDELKVVVSFPKLGTKDLTITDIQVLNVPEGMSYELMAQALTVRVRGVKGVVERVSPADVTVTIDFANYADVVAGLATYTPVITVDTTKNPGVGAIGSYSLGLTLKEGVEPASETTP